MTAYNPFSKDVSQLGTEDLQELTAKQVAEGWFVEYKSAFQNNLKTAHSIAAFANSDGGWLIVGVASSVPGNIASAFPGLDLKAFPNPKEKLRDIVKAHVQPVPYFESAIIPVGEDRAVLVVRVDRGDDGPCVTSDGKIYRRVGEGSDPIAETDRYAIQKLFDRGDFERELIREFCSCPYEMSKGQAKSQQCLLEIYFWIPPFSKKRIKDFHTKEFIEKLRTTFLTPVKFMMDPLTASVKLDSFYASAGSYLFRQVPNGSEQHALGLTLEIFDTGSMRWLIPVQQIDVKSGQVPPSIKDSKIFEEFLGMLPRESKDLLKIIDGYALFTTISALFGQYCKLLTEQGITDELNIKIRLTECWRTILFLDDENYIKRLKDHGLPVGLKSTIEIPAGSGSGRGGGPIPIDPKAASGLAYCVYEALGCPLVLVTDAIEGLGYYILGKSKPLASSSVQ